MRRQPQARQTKQKARIDAFYKLEKSTKPRVRDPSLDLGEEGQRRLGGNILKVSEKRDEDTSEWSAGHTSAIAANACRLLLRACNL